MSRRLPPALHRNPAAETLGVEPKGTPYSTGERELLGVPVEPVGGDPEPGGGGLNVQERFGGSTRHRACRAAR
jgi:hypothetical protein